MSRNRQPPSKGGRIVRFLVELEAILDTRLGLMDVLDPESAGRLIANPGYYTREVDRFEPLCGMDDDIYQEAWKQRDKTALMHSINTPVLDMVHYMVTEVEYLAVGDPTLSGAAVDVNIHPYKLSKEEVHELAVSIARRCGVHASIRILNQPMAYFTPQLCRHDYYAMVLYNHIAWFDAHQRELFAYPIGIPAVTMYAPRLGKNLLPPELKDFSKHGMVKELDVFDAVAHSLQQFITLEYLPVNQFCIAYPGVNGFETEKIKDMARQAWARKKAHEAQSEEQSST